MLGPCSPAFTFIASTPSSSSSSSSSSPPSALHDCGDHGHGHDHHMLPCSHHPSLIFITPSHRRRRNTRCNNASGPDVQTLILGASVISATVASLYFGLKVSLYVIMSYSSFSLKVCVCVCVYVYMCTRTHVFMYMYACMYVI